MKELGIIGCGNMGRAILSGALAGKLCGPEDVAAADVSRDAAKAFEKEFGVTRLAGAAEVCREAKALLLAVKPQVYEGVIDEIRGACREGQLILSIAPGKTLSWLSERFGKPVHLARAMPNTPALVGAGMTAVCFGGNVPEGQKAWTRSLFESFGRAQEVPEALMDAVVAVSGSSPAYVFLLIEAMADAAVSQGMPRGQAVEFAAQAVLGSAKMVLETGMHPGQLKDMVCSPGGTTIEAVKVLEKTGFRGSVQEAMGACWEKSRGM